MQVQRISPIVVGFMLAKAVYWCAVTHGAVTVMTVRLKSLFGFPRLKKRRKASHILENLI